MNTVEHLAAKGHIFQDLLSSSVLYQQLFVGGVGVKNRKAQQNPGELHWMRTRDKEQELVKCCRLERQILLGKITRKLKFRLVMS